MKKLTDTQRKFYESALSTAKEEIEDLNSEIQKELAAVKERITKLNNEIKAVKQIYDGACRRLGIENDLEAGLSSAKTGDADKIEDVDEDYALEEELMDTEDDEELEY
ncbi:hypothetical protein JW905_17470 [bacterium]|nr:hypothetical protein [candidate division CSSED10-310 bacterium]